MTELAQRLVEAATSEIVNAPHDDHGVPDYEVAGQGAAAAVLRELADTGRRWSYLDLRALAVSIEGSPDDH
jgi:hypothetical protein